MLSRVVPGIWHWWLWAGGSRGKAVPSLAPAEDIPDKHGAGCVSQWVLQPVFSLCCPMGLVNAVSFISLIAPTLGVIGGAFSYSHMLFLLKSSFCLPRLKPCSKTNKQTRTKTKMKQQQQQKNPTWVHTKKCTLIQVSVKFSRALCVQQLPSYWNHSGNIENLWLGFRFVIMGYFSWRFILRYLVYIFFKGLRNSSCVLYAQLSSFIIQNLLLWFH